MSEAGSFYLPVGTNRYLPTEATTSPWDPEMQHGGPPAALLGTVLEDLVRGETPNLRLARIAVDFHGPIPRREGEVSTSVPRPGRRTQLVEAALRVDGRLVVTARAWFITTGSGPNGAAPADGAAPPPLPGPQPQRYFPGLTEWGYGEAIEWRFVTGGYHVPGPAQVWTRVRVPLLPDRPLTGSQRVLLVVDSANGVSAALPLGEWLFIPPALTVTLTRHPESEWTYLAARSDYGPDGIGLTHCELADAAGPVGTAGQPLLVAPR